jgi:predicted GNAT family acetyltransferase
MSTVHDNPALHRFELEVDGVIAFSEYRHKPGVVIFTHTEVPESLGGKGVGSKLARGALDLVRARGEKVIAKCPFIAAFIKKNAAYQDLLAEPL